MTIPVAAQLLHRRTVTAPVAGGTWGFPNENGADGQTRTADRRFTNSRRFVREGSGPFTFLGVLHVRVRRRPPRFAATVIKTVVSWITVRSPDPSRPRTPDGTLA